MKSYDYKHEPTKLFSWKMVMMGGWPGICLLIYPVIGVIFSRVRAGGDSSIDGSALVFILYTFVCFGVGLTHILRHRDFLSKLWTKTPFVWFIVFASLCLISIVWSVNIPITGFRAFEQFSYIIIISATLITLYERTGDTEEVFRWSLLWCAERCLLGLYSYYRLAVAIGYEDFAGVAFTAAQGTAPMFFWIAVLKGRNDWPTRIIAVLFSVYSQSTTSLIGMTLGTVAFLFSSSKYRIPVIIGGLLLVITVSIVGFRETLAATLFKEKHSEIAEAQSIDDVMSASSGRDWIWRRGMEMAAKRPLTGYGYVAAEQKLVRERLMYNVINAHNCFINACINCGYLGGILIIIFFLSYIPFLIRKLPAHYRTVMIATFIVALVNSVGNPGIGGRVYGSWLACIYVILLASAIVIFENYYASDEEDDEEEIDNEEIESQPNKVVE